MNRQAALATLVLGTLLLGCGVGVVDGAADGEAPEGDDGADLPSFPPGPQPPPRSFDPNDLLSDDMIFGGEAITSAQMQDFLLEQGSYLAEYTDPASGRSGAEVIVEVSHDRGVNPLYIVARIQTESSLITSGTSKHLAAATGCGCPDGGGCDGSLSGFAGQVDCAGERMERYFADLDDDGTTVSGWAVGKPKRSLDPCSITPANRATAALYTYTPWVGAYSSGCGTSRYAGSSLVARSYYEFWSAYPWGTDP